MSWKSNEEIVNFIERFPASEELISTEGDEFRGDESKRRVG